VWITHGREEGLLRWAELERQQARALQLVGFEDEED
jgi:putative mRNA 3-end processing factor